MLLSQGGGSSVQVPGSPHLACPGRSGDASRRASGVAGFSGVAEPGRHRVPSSWFALSDYRLGHLPGSRHSRLPKRMQKREAASARRPVSPPPSGAKFLIGPDAAAGPETLFIAYETPAALGCHLALRWPLPGHVLDLHAEFRWLTSGLPGPGDHDLRVPQRTSGWTTGRRPITWTPSQACCGPCWHGSKPWTCPSTCRHWPPGPRPGRDRHRPRPPATSNPPRVWDRFRIALAKLSLSLADPGRTPQGRRAAAKSLKLK